MLNSLNNKYLTVPGFLGKSSAQIKLSTAQKNINSINSSASTINVNSTNLFKFKNIIKPTNLNFLDANDTSRVTHQIKKEVIKTLQPLNSKQSYINLQQVDNKRFLFLYFIIPIFFSITRQKNIFNNIGLAHFNNQGRQFSSLIKLMLNSGSSTRSH
jgi:hypothetical protein